MGTYVLPLWVSMTLGVIVMNRYNTFLKSSNPGASSYFSVMSKKLVSGI